MTTNGIIGWLAAALLALATLRADATEIAFYFPVAVGGPVTSVIKDMVARFHDENPDIAVTPVYAGTYKETLAKSLTAHKNGVPPALAVLFAVDVFTLIDADAIVSYDDLPGSEDKSWLADFYPAFMENSRAAGKVWGVPFQRSTVALYWNKKMFAEADLDPEHPPSTWQEMLTYAQRLTRRNERGTTVRWGIQIPSSGFPYWLFQGLATTNGINLMNAAGTRTYFDNPAAVEALQYWVDLSLKHGVHPPGVVEWGTTPTDFVEGRAAMIWTTIGNMAAIRAAAKFDFGVAALPGNPHRCSPTGGGNLYLFKRVSPEQQQAALRFVRWLARPEQAARWSIDSGYIPVTPRAWEIPAMRQHEKTFPGIAADRQLLTCAMAELSTHENQRVTRALNRGLVAALNGTKTPQEALSEAQEQARRILLPYQR